ncbi:hypothetical protein A2V49_01130 [candidate division WWE3 bacterium RBG_19FT_COMBO_34_6]|uniref:Acyltransferase 3 domain-containing protein n=1 Tax=candidate division WWE3 bacterium RBG_19FT_COMBO_34_6 TaxID=1802612 RepID=A0A1F4UKN9_UNCKA|nr:MAG: hypothetical protein A2V49_01130 [candidate division WWE3 bacterium RBG_19FT_COMBO_34_6]
MHINILDPVFQTALFISFLIAATVFTAYKDLGPHEMNHSHTNELKGVAILMVIFSHIGYFLFSDHRFLFPLSVAGGVGVNIFLFLSGFGITSSELKHNKLLLHFYIKRLRNIFIPMWIVLISILILDFFILGKFYTINTIVQSILGFFPNSDIDLAINSPLWYFTLVLFYYLIFPLVFWRKKPIISIVIVLLLGYFVTSIKLPFTKDVLKLYQLHYLAFPLGMVFANLDKGKIGVRINNKLLKISSNPIIIFFLRYFLIFLLFLFFCYTALNSGVGEKIMTEQLLSLCTVLSLVLILLIKDIQSGILVILGKYSYEIYLIQWPFMYRHDFIYKYTPPFLGTLIYIALFLIIGLILNRIVKFIIRAR